MNREIMTMASSESVYPCAGWCGKIAVQHRNAVSGLRSGRQFQLQSNLASIGSPWLAQPSSFVSSTLGTQRHVVPAANSAHSKRMMPLA